MKNVTKIVSIIIFVAVIGFSFSACDNDNDGNSDIVVTFSSVTANGSVTQTTTQLTLTISQAITDLGASDITLSGIPGVTKGTLSGSGPEYALGISGFSAGGTLNVTIAKSGYTISDSSKTVTIFYYSGGGSESENEAEANKRRLFNYLTDEYGKSIISGQMDTAWTTNASMDMIARVYTDTGKYPAIKGFDFIGLPNSWDGYGQDQIDEAIEWWEGKNNNVKLLTNKPDIHGIVTFCWHWRTGANNEFYTDRTSFRIPWKNNSLDTASTAFINTIKSDLDKVAVLLQKLKDKDIPVLWRPLHEAAGNYKKYGNTGNEGAWFWWGASGPQPYIALWEYMHNYLTNEKKLDNLIWVWNGQHKDFFPNPATVDIVGYDVYAAPQDYSSQKDMFDETRSMLPAGQNRMVALTENGVIPDPDECISDSAMWSWFMTWNDGYGSYQGETRDENFWTGNYHNTQAHKVKVYNHSAVITLDKLPDLTKYRLEGDNNTLVISLAKNGEWGWQYLLRSDSLFNGAKITQGDVYTFTYSFTSNVNMDKFSVFFADNVGGWKQISDYVDVKTNITAGTVTTGTVTITAEGTATNATAEAKIMGFDAGTGTLSAPTLTFTTFNLQKNN
jgi:mannan endo-1,4-beta-mannosidase